MAGSGRSLGAGPWGLDLEVFIALPAPPFNLLPGRHVRGFPPLTLRSWRVQSPGTSKREPR